MKVIVDMVIETPISAFQFDVDEKLLCLPIFWFGRIVKEKSGLILKTIFDSSKRRTANGVVDSLTLNGIALPKGEYHLSIGDVIKAVGYMSDGFFQTSIMKIK